MTRLVLLMSLAGLLFTPCVPLAVAEELTAKDYVEYVKPFVGSWKLTIDRDGNVAEGTYRARLARADACIIARISAPDLGSFQSINGYDPVAKKWTVIGFGADGRFMVQRVTMHDIQKGQHYAKGQSQNAEFTVHQPDGTIITMTSKSTLDEITEDRMVFVQSDGKLNGESVPGEKWTLERLPEEQRGPRATAENQVADSAELTARDYITFLKPFEGSWKTKVETEGEVAEGTWSGWISSTGTCFLSQSVGTGFPSSQGIDGYDPVSKKWTVAGFDADGGFFLSRLEFVGVQKGQVFDKGATANAEDQQFKEDGTTTTTTSKFTCVECTENRIAYVLSDRKENGVAKPDQTFSMERQPDQGKRGRR